MPIVSVNRARLLKAIGKEYSEAELNDGTAKREFEQLCFDFGLELDEETSESQMMAAQTGGRVDEGVSEEIIYRIEIPANRYDLLCPEGIIRGLNIFLSRAKAPRYRLVPAATPQVLNITANTQSVRPHAVAAVLRGVTFTQERYDSFIDLQDKLHQNICRKRSLVAIGTHDLDTVQGPFTYDARAPADIKFKPLRSPEPREYNAKELMKAYESDLQLREYLHIIRDEPKYPVIVDSNDAVLSMPPIINGDRSRITLDTKNVFIECTATDLTKAKIVLNIIVCMFSEHCAEPFTIEPVVVRTPEGTQFTYPCNPYGDAPEAVSEAADLGYRVDTITASLVYRRSGIPTTVPPKDLANLLTKMQHHATLQEDGDTISVEIPPVRPDVIHACDIWEDVAVAFGFNNIPIRQPKVCTVGQQLAINELTDQLRTILGLAGYYEALTFALCTNEDNFEKLRRPDDGKTAVLLSNPATVDFQVVRANLLSGLLKTVYHNPLKLPIKVFEVSDVVLKDPTAETGTRNHRRLAAVHASKTPGFDEVHALLHQIMKMLNVPFSPDADKPTVWAYCLRESGDPAFFNQLGAADIIFQGKRVGVIGVVHPEVLENYRLKAPCAALELDVEPFLETKPSH